MNMAYCDGTVRFISFEVDPAAHHLGGHIADGGNTVSPL
jgi:hypothetical protein